jgi:P27 family predicted phage terminase small subunit
MAPKRRNMNLFTEADAPAFARYCKHYARWLELQKRLDKHGDIYEIETASGKVRRADPAFVMADRLDRMLLAIEDRFGLARLTILPPRQRLQPNRLKGRSAY